MLELGFGSSVKSWLALSMASVVVGVRAWALGILVNHVQSYILSIQIKQVLVKIRKKIIQFSHTGKKKRFSDTKVYLPGPDKKFKKRGQCYA